MYHRVVEIGTYSAAVSSVNLANHVHSMVVLIGLPRSHRVSCFFHFVDDCLNCAQHRRMWENLDTRQYDSFQTSLRWIQLALPSQL
jgi:hypothetical protein